MNKQIIRDAVVEDDSRLRRTFTDILDDADECECVGVFATGQQAIRGIPPLAPDVLIMDVNLPDSSGVECVAALSPQLPDTQILMVTVYQERTAAACVSPTIARSRIRGFSDRARCSTMEGGTMH